MTTNIILHESILIYFYPSLLSSFDGSNNYNFQNSPAISQATIVELNPTTGQIVKQWGENLFYMPHGLTIDQSGSYWLTDVALHQVFKFTPQDTIKASLTLGQPFEHGKGEKHFCKPTSVAVHSKSHHVFVADGYCNSRVVKFNSKGDYIDEFDAQRSQSILPSANLPLKLAIPHKIVLIEESNTACIADRENGRVVCIDIDSGLVNSIIRLQDSNPQIFSLSYAPCLSGSLFIVDGVNRFDSSRLPRGYLFSLTSKSLVAKIPPDSSQNNPLRQPHDIQVSSDCSQVFISEIGPNRVSKFESDSFSHDKAAIAEAEVISKESTDESFWSRSSIISMLSLVVIVTIVAVRSFRQPISTKLASLRNRFRSRSDTFDLSRLLEDPEKSGFNRVSTTETDMDADLSDSEVEEFNVSSLRGNQRVTT